MNSILKYKSEKTRARSQFIFIDQNGFVINSCEAIFNTKDLRQKPIYEWFPLLESIYNFLSSMKLGDEGLLLSRLNAPYVRLSGIYDFRFSKEVIEDKTILLWEIHDYTTLYRDFIRQQQACNELIIKQERINAIQMVLQTQRHNLTKRNSDLEQLQIIKDNFYNNIDEVIQDSKQKGNALLLSKKVQDQDTINYITAIEQSFLQTKNFVEELIILTNTEGINEFNEHTFDFVSLKNKIISQFKVDFTGQSVKLSINSSPDIPAKIIGNYTFIRHLISGFILHYAKLIKNGQITIYFTPTLENGLSLIQTNIRLQTLVPNKKLPIFLGKVKLFNHFELNGLGEISSEIELRLSLIRQFVEQHHGHFNIINKNDKDIDFSFTFPYTES